MSNTKHTPGPWHTGGNGTIIYAQDGFAVANATVFHGRHEGQSEANARLLAAAPELQALANRVAALNRDAGEIGAGMLASLVDEARAAIAKATGG